jgi:hypothetical protein
MRLRMLTMRSRLMTLAMLAAATAVTAMVAAATSSCSSQRDPATAEEKFARGDRLLRQMSDTLKNAKAFSVTVDEAHQRVRRNGEKLPYKLKRDVIVRRPDRLWSHTTGSDDRDVRVMYDGKSLTVVGDRQKVYATIGAPATLDETLDLISERYDLRVAVADFLYSAPYDSFDASDATGGWARRVTVDGRECEEMSYVMKAVDVTLSVTAAAPVLPCRARITYKAEPGQPVTTLVFYNWNLQAAAPDSQFAANVPQGYEAIPIVERIPKTELKSDAARAMGAAARK